MTTFRVEIGGENLAQASQALTGLTGVPFVFAPKGARYTQSADQSEYGSRNVVAHVRADTAEEARNLLRPFLPDGSRIIEAEPLPDGDSGDA